MTLVVKITIVQRVTTHKKRPVLLAFFCCFLAAFLLTACSDSGFGPSSAKQLALSGPTMGTAYNIKFIVPENHLDVDELHAEVDEALRAYNMQMSTYIDTSELSRFNTSEIGNWQSVSSSLFNILSMSEGISQRSEGAFDVTVGPLVNAWGFGPNARNNIPSEQVIADLQARVGYKFLELNQQEREIRRVRDIYVDLSSIAKGYGVDVVAKLFDDRGIDRYMIEIGGEVKIKGRNSSGKTWTIGVEKPSLGRQGALQAISGDNVAIATSGDYRNFYEHQGQRVSHTIDPVSGRPITHNLASVTVVASSCGLADGYATAINVLGPEKGFELASKLNMAAYFIIREKDEFSVKYTPEFEQYMVH